MRYTLMLLVILLAGCATITKGVNQTVSVYTPVPADCTMSSESIGTYQVRAPGSVSLPKSRQPITVSCTAECYAPATGMVTAEFEPMTVGNVILGGGIGLVVDWASGAYTNYQPNITVPMERLPNCKA